MIIRPYGAGIDNCQDAMDMIGHDHVFVQFDLWEMDGYVNPTLL